MAAARVLPLPKPPPDNLPDTEVARARAALREARAALRAADE